MANYDEALLRGQVIQPAAPWPVLHQAVRIALYDEYAARAYYAAVIQAFGAQAPFAAIAQAKAQLVAALSNQAERYGIPRPFDPFPAETTISPSWRINLARGVAGEIANIRLYDNLSGFVVEPDALQVFRNSQAASRDHHLPAFQRALDKAVRQESWHARQGVMPNQAYVRHGPLTDALERGFALLARQHGAFGLLSPLVRLTDPAMLAGMAAGGAAVHWLRHPKRKTAQSVSTFPQPFLSTKEN